MNYLEEAKKKFDNDTYATEVSNIVIDEVASDYARCSMKIDRRHLNANDLVMGGAIFTLADYTFAVAANTDDTSAVSLSANISYMRPTAGPVLYAEAKCIKDGRRVCFYEVTVTDSLNKIIATITVNGFCS